MTGVLAALKFDKGVSGGSNQRSRFVLRADHRRTELWGSLPWILALDLNFSPGLAGLALWRHYRSGKVDAPAEQSHTGMFRFMTAYHAS